jgi:hypothetical protein
MKKFGIAGLIMVFTILGCTRNQTENTRDNDVDSEVLTVGQVMDSPGNYADNRIKVEGMVTHVCRHGGKRLHLSASGSDLKLRVRTGENVAPFERSLEGSTIRISGILSEERFDQAYLEKLKQGETKKESHKEHNNASSSPGGVSQAYINELEHRIQESEKGYISQYWLTAEEVTQK